MTKSTPSAGHDPALPAFTRRSLLRASPTLLAPGLLASPAFASPDTPLMALFREWDALQARWHGLSDEESDVLRIEDQALRDRIEAEPATSMPDLAAKVVALSLYGDFCLPKAVTAECEALLAEGLV